MSNIYEKESPELEEKRQYECRTNKMVACIILGLVSINVITQFMMRVQYSQNVSNANRYLFLPLSAVLVLFDIIALYCRFDRPWIKYMLTGGVVLMTVAEFFVFTVFTSYYVLIPLVVSSRYFDKSFALKMNALTLFLFAAACILNISLADSWEFIHSAHEWNIYDPWGSMMEAVVFVIIPLGLTVLFLATYGTGTTINGGSFLKSQARAMGQIAAVDAELKMAADLQQSALPPRTFTCPDSNLSLQADEIPAKVIGGDFYDYFLLNDHTLAVLIADVSDKGIPAAMFMMSAQKAIRYALESSRDLASAIEGVNRFLCNNNDGNMFLTLWMGMIDTRTGKGKYVNAGHPYPLVKKASGEIRWLENNPDLFIGVFPESLPRVHTFSLEPGDTLLLFTDGITDAENKESESFGLQGILNAMSGAEDADSAVKTVMEQSVRFAGGRQQFDDMTLLALHCVKTEPLNTRNFETKASLEGTTLVIDGINRMLNSVDCPQDVRRNAEMVADELCANIADYAYEGEEGPLTVRATAGANFIRLVFCDEGEAFNPMEQAEPELEEEPEIGGLGIYLVKNFTDEISYRRTEHTNELTVEIIWNV